MATRGRGTREYVDFTLASRPLGPELRAIADEMGRMRLARSVPDDELYPIPSIAEGPGLLALLDHAYGRAGDAETVRRLGTVDDITWVLQQELEEAAEHLGFSSEKLEELYRAHMTPSISNR
jgi:hypothetical protein